MERTVLPVDGVVWKEIWPVANAGGSGKGWLKDIPSGVEVLPPILSVGVEEGGLGLAALYEGGGVAPTLIQRIKSWELFILDCIQKRRQPGRRGTAVWANLKSFLGDLIETWHSKVPDSIAR